MTFHTIFFIIKVLKDGRGMILRMSTMLVTGGAGFIGSHTSIELMNAGHDVIILDNLYNSKSNSLDVIERIAIFATYYSRMI